MEGGEGKLLLKERVQNKIQFLKEKQRLRPLEVYNLVRLFFKEYFENDYEYTREELISELDGIYLDKEEKKRFKRMIRELGRVEFQEPEFSREELEQILDDLSHAVDVLVQSDTQHLGVWEWIAKKCRAKLQGADEEPEEMLQEELDELDAIGEQSQQVEDLDDAELRDRFSQRLDTFQSALDDSVETAEEEYDALLRLYDAMSDEMKQEFYDTINQAYARLDDAMSSRSASWSL